MEIFLRIINHDIPCTPTIERWSNKWQTERVSCTKSDLSGVVFCPFLCDSLPCSSSHPHFSPLGGVWTKPTPTSLPGLSVQCSRCCCPLSSCPSWCRAAGPLACFDWFLFLSSPRSLFESSDHLNISGVCHYDSDAINMCRHDSLIS